ncbi:N-acetylglucosamine kinase [Niabella drilacis]|uniref:BadF-type ATPase n=1 Tax=Niabella drilacis (strain DSM 25811 / CCM 8410 / CCUG 62505 / LMG 26954 / E90) TaxID=1285928 RepID=A0A1G6KS30_NIADE|nr:N-acetylglucosamine kinase [Niabella drilacis]SDC33902.1 BadF-type ATPase [Niabella drilacis]
MSKVQLIADAGSTKVEWCLLNNGKTKTVLTSGVSPYFLNGDQIVTLLETALLPKLKNVVIEEVFYYGTGCLNPDNRKMVQKSLRRLFREAKIQVWHDVEGAARGLCGRTKGIACILGTGASACYYDGRKIQKNSPGLGYVLGDEGSGAYLGRKVIQYFLYNTFDEDLRARFDAAYVTNATEILERVYKQPLPNRYLASFAKFLADNRGHYMVENIIEDGLNDFFFTHLCKFQEAWKYPISFVGSIAFGFKDVLKELCSSYSFELGKVLQKPMKGLIEYHS